MQGRRLFMGCASLMCGAAVLLSGCSPLRPWAKEGLSAGQPRILPSDIAKQEMTVPRSEFVKRLRERGTVDGLRPVAILKGQSYEVQAFPEYRLFGIKKGSVYELLGLQNADILVSAQGFIIRDSRIFPEYIALLKNQPAAEIEIRRNDRPLLLKVAFKD